MKIKKFKKFQRSIAFFVKNYKFRAPYSVLVDGTFAKAALDNKVNLRDQLPKYLDAQVNLLTTPCSIVETENLGPALYGALQILKTFALHKCPHSDKPLPASKCFKSIGKQIKKQDGGDELQVKYIIATQDIKLRKKLRKIPGIPLMYLYGSAPVLERPSTVTAEVADKKELQKMDVLEYQKEILNKMKKVTLDQPTGTERKGTKKRKRAGPNPLSCKKSKKAKAITKSPATNDVSIIKTKKKRKRTRLASHVKLELAIQKG